MPLTKPIAVRVDIEKDLTDMDGINSKPHYSIFIQEATGEDIDKIMMMLDRKEYVMGKIVDFKGKEYQVNSDLELELTEEFQDLPF